MGYYFIVIGIVISTVALWGFWLSIRRRFFGTVVEAADPVGDAGGLRDVHHPIFSNGKENNEGNVLPNVMRKNKDLKNQIDKNILLEKEATIRALNEKNQLLIATISKLEQLLKVKDARITKLQEDLHRKFSSSSVE